jgi:F-type H+-transporting ATPase subunit delta
MFARQLAGFARAVRGVRFATDGAASDNALKLTFAAPHEAFYTKQAVEMVTVPGESGVFGILPNHVPTVAKLQPGVVIVKEKEGVEKRIFVSSGFAIISPKNELTINAIEAVPVENIDKDVARKGLDDFSNKVASATNDADRARAQIGVDVHRALASAAGL